MNDILTVSGLNKSYGDFSLKDVTFSLPEGCITGFIGVNGAGKTTTLRTLLGLTNKLSHSSCAAAALIRMNSMRHFQISVS